MNRNRVYLILFLLLLVCPSLGQETLRLTSKSAAAKGLYEQGMVHFENTFRKFALEKFAASLNADPSFAMAHAGMFLLTPDPQEERKHVERARALLRRTNSGERLFITWAIAQSENRRIDAITAMNEFIAMFPREKRYLTFFARWLQFGGNHERAIDVIEKYILKVDPDHVAALNYLGYAYSDVGRLDDAIATMRHTVALRPNEPNPHDSLAEFLRQAGRFEEALAEFRRANELTDGFSSASIGDTLALMGRHQEARAEYTRATSTLVRARTTLEIGFRNAVTYIRERDFKGADRAFMEFAAQAHSQGAADAESSAHTAMAMYAREPLVTLAHLNDAETVLQHKHQLSDARLQQQNALILRLRVSTFLRAGRPADARAALERLAALAKVSRDDAMQRIYYGARGEMFLAEGNLEEAMNDFGRDPYNAFSQYNRILALNKSGEIERAKNARARILSRYDLAIEHAVVRNRLTE